MEYELLEYFKGNKKIEIVYDNDSSIKGIWHGDNEISELITDLFGKKEAYNLMNELRDLEIERKEDKSDDI